MANLWNIVGFPGGAATVGAGGLGDFPGSAVARRAHPLQPGVSPDGKEVGATQNVHGRSVNRTCAVVFEVSTVELLRRKEA